LKWLNRLVILLSITSTCLVIDVAVNYYLDFEQKWIRIAALSGILILYITSYIIFLIKKGLSFIKIMYFSISYVALGILVEFTLHGYSKNWAPSSSAEATQATIVLSMVALSIIGMGIYIFSRKK